MFQNQNLDFEGTVFISGIKSHIALTPVIRSLTRELNSEQLYIVDGNGKRKGEIFMNTQTRETFQTIGSFLIEMSKLKNKIILPSGREELSSFVAQAMSARTSGVPIPLFTPFCPDWSQDGEGRYDFKSLGGGVSRIAQKVFEETPPFLSALKRHGIPYVGILIFANWGLETEIQAKDTYGAALSDQDVQMCFQSTLAATDEALDRLQHDLLVGELFQTYHVVTMTDFFRQSDVRPEEIAQQAKEFFESSGGMKLTRELHEASIAINKKRLGLDEEANKALVIQTLAEYATLGQALGARGVIMPAESYTSSKAYNLMRSSKLPVLYLKGKRGVVEGVNIL